MRCVFALALAATVLTALAAEPVKPKTAAKSKPTHRVVGARNTSNTRRVVTRRKVNGRWVTVARTVPAGPPLQQHPDPERYTEIQKSLAERGYFKGEPNGQWSSESADALKRFQADQKLTNDGKLNSLTLMALGLGPKHDAGSVPAKPPQP